MNTRNSSFELVKVIGMVIIGFFHSYMTITITKDLFYPQLSEGIIFADLPDAVTKLIFMVTDFGGNIGNLIFFICAMWFLCDSSKMRLQKVVYLVVTSFIISIGHLLIIPLLFSNISLPGGYVLISLFPLTFNNNWFITCYLLLYLIHGGLNLIIKNMDQATHLAAAAVMFFIYSIITLYADRNLYFSSNIVVCVMLYFLVSYIKKYMNTGKAGFVMIAVSCIGYCGLIASKLLGFPPIMKSQELLFFDTFTNPFSILLVTGVVVLAAQRHFVNKGINYISGLSLVFYLIHENKLFREIVRPVIWETISISLANRHILLRYTLFALLIIFYGLVMSMIFDRVCTPHIKRVSAFLAKKITSVWAACCRRIA